MSNMIPPFIKESTVSNAEKKVFKLLKNSSSEYTVLHSLGIANHKSKVFGEIDFVVICNEGILCLEVKGGQVYREEGIWHFIDRNNNENISNEGPFNQVIGSMFSLRDYMKNNFRKYNDLNKCQYVCGVIFPDIIFNQRDPEIIDDIVYDSRYADEDFEPYIKRVFNYWRGVCKEKHGFEGMRLTNENISRAVTFLRGNFGAIPSLDYIVNETDKQILLVTEEQFSKFEMINDNDRVIVKGGAGTGKTLIGIEFAKKLAVTDKKVLYLCYNRLLAEYLNECIIESDSQIQDYITIKTLHGLLTNYVDFTDNESYMDKDYYYNTIIPERFLDYVITNDLDLFDVIIIDEAQDLLKNNYLMCINELLVGGIKQGKWCVFYDPNQNIYNKEFEETIIELEQVRPAIFTLNTNCRNTEQIGIQNTLLSGIRSEKYLKINGENVNIDSYNNRTEQVNKLIKFIKNLKSQGVNVGDIVILSPYSFENSCLNGENVFRNICQFQNITHLKYKYFINESLKFCTIQSFKGLEAKIIILIDIDNLKEENRRFLNYTGISRAKTLLYILYDSNIQNELNECMIRAYKILNNLL